VICKVAAKWQHQAGRAVKRLADNQTALLDLPDEQPIEIA
jgi:hypothetical protein